MTPYELAKAVAEHGPWCIGPNGEDECHYCRTLKGDAHADNCAWLQHFRIASGPDREAEYRKLLEEVRNTVPQSAIGCWACLYYGRPDNCPDSCLRKRIRKALEVGDE